MQPGSVIPPAVSRSRTDLLHGAALTGRISSGCELKILVSEPKNRILIDPFGGAQESAPPVVVLDVFRWHRVTASQQVA